MRWVLGLMSCVVACSAPVQQQQNDCIGGGVDAGSAARAQYAPCPDGACLK